jgi:hypothetical protein
VTVAAHSEAPRSESGSRLPDFFLVGAAKGGTTWLYQALRAHPEIYMSPVKEPHYFATDIDPTEFSEGYQRSLAGDWAERIRRSPDEIVHCAHLRSSQDYHSLFQRVSGERAVGEASNSYLFSREAPAQIQAAVPEARILMVLREPVSRAYSDYLMSLRLGITRDSFLAELRRDRAREDHRWGRDVLYVENGLYAEKVERYLARFGRERVLVLLHDELSADPGGCLERIYAFLGVRRDWRPPSQERANEARVPRSPGLNRFLRQRGLERAARWLPGLLRDPLRSAFFSDTRVPALLPSERAFAAGIFRRDLVRLSKLLGRDLSAWLGAG